jgi:hypothetical protein
VKPGTHLETGLVLGLALGISQSDPKVFLGILSFACLGAIIPDVPIVLSVVEDKCRGRAAFSQAQNSGPWFIVKDLSHSPLFWVIGLVLVAFNCLGGYGSHLLLAFSVGFFSHWLLDILSHGGSEYEDLDSTMIFPFAYILPHSGPEDIFKLSHYLYKHGWAGEYRGTAHQINQTKKLEVIFRGFLSLVCVFLIIWRLL